MPQLCPNPKDGRDHLDLIATRPEGTVPSPTMERTKLLFWDPLAAQIELVCTFRLLCHVFRAGQAPSTWSALIFPVFDSLQAKSGMVNPAFIELQHHTQKK